MAIKPCKECGAPVSDKAESCPMCGAKQPKKTSVITWVVVGFIVLTILMGVFGGSGESDSSSQEASQPTEKKENKAGALLFFAQQQIKSGAKDPESVQFRGEQLHENTELGAVACGEANGKNSFGAYTGFKGFVAVEKDNALYMQDGVNGKKFIEKWNKFCVK